MADRLRFDVTAVAPKADLTVVPVFEGRRLGPGGAEAERAHGGRFADAMKRHDVTGKAHETLMIPGAEGAVLLVGVGPAADVDLRALRDAAMLAGGAARPFGRVVTALPQILPGVLAVQAFAEGFLLGAYRFDGRKTSPDPHRTTRVTVLVPKEAAADTKRGLKQGAITGRATNWARDLTNASSSDATPEFLAEEARSMAKASGLTCKIWTKSQLERGGFGGILGVGSGGANEPRLVELGHTGGRSKKPIAITGKGITFDSGGLDLKKPAHMVWMRSDKAGGAAALAAMRAIAELGVKANVIAAVPFAENLPGPAAVKPGDVLVHRGGRTSEVIDTDAEGRVLVADALAFLSEREPAVILDSATLTDASGLGADLHATFASDRDLAAEFLAAAEEAGEPGWEIPLWSRYRPLIDSPVADVKNLGSHDIDSSMMAALFLQDFVGNGVPWVHVDSGSSAWAEYPTALWPEGATGLPTRAFVRFVQRRAGS